LKVLGENFPKHFVVAKAQPFQLTLSDLSIVLNLIVYLEMARLLFDMFYDDDCVSEETFYEWLRHPDQSETEGNLKQNIIKKNINLNISF